MTIENGVSNVEWTTDSGASAHMTSDVGILTNLHLYIGEDHVLVGNGDILPINHMGDTSIQLNSSKIHLDNVLLVPELECNLLSVGQLTSTHPVNCEFDHTGFNILNKKTRRVLMQGRKRGNLYVLPTALTTHFSVRHKAVPFIIWHQRLGHP
ncbi:hypothetical protein I3843_10G034100 [Carya illinoinensis]|nr:hypothetical protein I3843_10G034100 [Carya illinoinensis]